MLIIALAAIMSVTSCTKERSKKDRLKPEPEQPSTSTPPPTGARQFTLEAGSDGYLVVDDASGTYKGGDVINLKGSFKAVVFSNITGSAGNPIIIRNLPGTVLKIGDPSWNGGSWSTALAFRNAHFIKVEGSSKSDFVINGSTQSGRTAYFNLAVAELSDNFEISNLTITNGGTGLWAKTEIIKGNTATYFPNRWMENLSIHDIVISGTFNEGMYIGHTATYWNVDANAPYYSKPPAGATGYVQPIKWRNVKIYNNLVKDGGADGIQTAAIEGLEVYKNEITNWGQQHNSSHSGGLLIGGRVTSSNVHDNYVHGGWGELFQFFASGENGAKHIVNNNLFADNFANDGVSFRGTDNAVVQFSNNTVARTYGVSLRFNGYEGMKTAQQVYSNALIQPRTTGGFTIDARSYIYTENEAVVQEGTGATANTKFANTALAGIDVNNLFQPTANSQLGTTGYRK
ncbi:right-handed parallel beta-helix repeat-containing protein [Chitinophaga lutea]